MNYDWKTPIQDMLNSLIIEEELPAQSLYLMPNYGKDKKKITSYSICIYEADYPESPNAKDDPDRKSIVLNIKVRDNNLELLISKYRFDKIDTPVNSEVKELKSDSLYMHVTIAADHPELIDYIKRNTMYVYDNYQSKALSFGCCGKFNECSDAKKCLHENKIYSKACIYRKHLEAGEIFYGKNRNVD